MIWPRSWKVLGNGAGLTFCSDSSDLPTICLRRPSRKSAKRLPNAARITDDRPEKKRSRFRGKSNDPPAASPGARLLQSQEDRMSFAPVSACQWFPPVQVSSEKVKIDVIQANRKMVVQKLVQVSKSWVCVSAPLAVDVHQKSRNRAGDAPCYSSVKQLSASSPCGSAWKSYRVGEDGE